MILTEEDLARELEALAALDARLRPVVDRAGAIPLRKTPGGLKGLIGTIVGQQVSRASAAAIFGRLERLIDLEDPKAIVAATEEDFRLAGMSRGKQRTVIGIAEACLSGALDFDRLSGEPPQNAITELSALHGIGPWTAESFLLFSAGHPDIFPAGDVALQAAVAHAFQMPARPKEKALKRAAEAWAPHRSVAARLFWAYYAVITRRDATPAEVAAVIPVPAGGPKAPR
jgi:DNA-3-methyladenine glycosylase II